MCGMLLLLGLWSVALGTVMGLVLYLAVTCFEDPPASEDGVREGPLRPEGW